MASRVSFTAPAGREALEGEAITGQPRDGERGEHRGGTGRDGHGHALIGGGDDEPVAGIGHRGHAGVGDDEDAASRARLSDELGRPVPLVVLVEGEQAPAHAYAQPLSEREGPPSVLRGDDVGVREPRPQSCGGVPGVSDGSGRQGDGAAARHVGVGRGRLRVRQRRGGVTHGSSMVARLDSRP